MPTFKIQVLPWQAAFLQNKDRWFGVLGGLGAGKTFIASAWFIDRVMQFPRGKHCIAGRDRKQLIRGTVQTFHQELRNRGIRFDFARNDGTTTIKETGCRIELLPAENYPSFRSLEADTIWADEISEWGPSGEKAFVEFLAPRVRPSPQGSAAYAERLQPQGRFSTNPPINTGHWLYDLLVNKHFCDYVHASTRDNHLLITKDPGYIDQLERSFSADLWPILIDGGWGNATKGNVYKAFDRRLHNDLVIPGGLPTLEFHETQLSGPQRGRPNPIMWMLDFNVGLMCSVVAQLHTQDVVIDTQRFQDPFQPVAKLKTYKKVAVDEFQEKIIYVIGEIRLEDAGAPDVAEAFISAYGEQARLVGVRLYGDPAGGSRAQTMSAKSSARSPWAIILKELHANGIKTSFRVPNQAPAILDRVNSVNLQLNTKGAVGVIANRDAAPHLCIDFESVKWREVSKDGEGLLNEIDKSNGNLTHLSDAFGYGIHIERLLQLGFKPKFKSPMMP